MCTGSFVIPPLSLSYSSFVIPPPSLSLLCSTGARAARCRLRCSTSRGLPAPSMMAWQRLRAAWGVRSAYASSIGSFPPRCLLPPAPAGPHLPPQPKVSVSHVFISDHVAGEACTGVLNVAHEVAWASFRGVLLHQKRWSGRIYFKPNGRVEGPCSKPEDCWPIGIGVPDRGSPASVSFVSLYFKCNG